MNFHMSPVESVATRNIPGIQAALTREAAVALSIDVLRRSRFTRLGFLNAHNANGVRKNAKFARVPEGVFALPDGVGVDKASRRRCVAGNPFFLLRSMRQSFARRRPST